MRKIIVAWMQDWVIDGKRHYIAKDKSGKVVFETTVYDCGHGAHIAHERLLAAGFMATTAEWACKMIRENIDSKRTW